MKKGFFQNVKKESNRDTELVQKFQIEMMLGKTKQNKPKTNKQN